MQLQNQSTLEGELFQKLFDSAPDPILIVSDEGIIALANMEAEKKFGYKVEELEDQPLEMLLPERFRQPHAVHRQIYTNNSPRTRPMGAGVEHFARRADGSEFPVEISLSPLRVDNNTYVISIMRDISDRKAIDEAFKSKAEQLEKAINELERSNGELEQFAYIASHDLQEPLRSIAGSCQMLKRRNAAKLDQESLEFIEYAVDGAKRMQELINDLLAFSRVSTKAKASVMTDLDQLLSKVLTDLRLAHAEDHAEITHDKLPSLCVDPTQMSLLFQNLVANSIKFRGKHAPVIHISAKRDGDFWHFCVQDNGIGIAPQYFDKIFVVFKRLHNHEEYPGTGIGLASCKKIVERHGGQIWVESSIGAGSKFHFTISTSTAN